MEFFFTFFCKITEFKKVIKYDWESPDYDPSEDKFIQRFDEKGKFFNPPKPEIIEETDMKINPFFLSNSNVVYNFIEKKKI